MFQLSAVLAAFAFLLVGLAGLTDAAESAISFRSIPPKVYWGCEYKLQITGSTGAKVKVVVIEDGDEDHPVFAVLPEGTSNSGLVDFLAVPAIRPGSNYQFFATDSNSKATSHTFEVVAVALAPSDCAAPQYQSTTFKVPSSTSSMSTAIESRLASSTDSTTLVTTVTRSSPPTLSTSTTVLAASTLSATAAIARKAKCHDVDPRVPNDWICGSNENCITLHDASSAICCKPSDNKDCEWSGMVECKVRVYSATDHGFFTSRVDTSFFACGTKCCPFGYTCVSGGDTGGSFCMMNVERSSVGKTPEELSGSPEASGVEDVAVSSTTGSMSPSVSPTLPAGGNIESGSEANASSDKVLATGTVAGITVASVAGVAFLVITSLLLIRHQRKKAHGDDVDFEIKPYSFSNGTQGVDGTAAASPEAREAGVNKEVGYHFEKDGTAIETPVQSPVHSLGVSEQNQIVRTSNASQPQSPSVPNQRVFELP